VQDRVDVVAGPDALAGLMAPDKVFFVIRFTEKTSRDNFPLPRANMPRCAEGGSVVVELFFGVIDAKNDLAFPAVVDRLLLERNYVSVAFRCLQQSRNVVAGNVVVIIDKRDVFAACDVNERLPFRADAAGAVVEKHKMLNWAVSNLLGNGGG
jgi:hypothetical protein